MFGYCGSMGLGGWLLMVGFWVGVIALVLWAVSRLFPATDRRADAEDLLAHRLAAGEIDPQAYRAARDELAGADRR
jgi:putative membrane protein